MDGNMENTLYKGYHDFVKANEPQKVSTINYLRFLYMENDITPEFLLFFHELSFPELVLSDNQLFIKTLFEQRYDKLNPENNDFQLWVNLIEITDLFDAFSEAEAMYFTERLVKSWNAKIKLEFPSHSDKAKLLYDNELQEVFITIMQD